MAQSRARALVVGATAVVLILAACGGGGTAAPSGAGSSAGPAQTEPATSFAPVGGGDCAVQITGAVTADWEREQDTSSVLVSYWLSPAERESLGQEGESFLVNCDGGDKGFLSLSTTAGTTAATFPEGPNTYEIPADSTTQPTPGQVTAMVTLPGDDLWSVAEPGGLGVSQLDGSRFSAMFEFTIGRWQPGAAEGVKPEATVKGSFDFACTTGGCN